MFSLLYGWDTVNWWDHQLVLVAAQLELSCFSTSPVKYLVFMKSEDLHLLWEGGSGKPSGKPSLITV